MPEGVQIGMAADGVYAVTGYIEGVVSTINTDRYISSVVNYAHVRLAEMCDFWIDGYAQNNQREMQHVYEWPIEFENYSETVGNPLYRLWKHVLTGQGRNKIATFRFTQSKRPSPVDPALTEPGKKGATVKEGVHIFHWKAKAMEYGVDITVTPKLAKFLAYAANGDRQNKGGADEGIQNIRLSNPEDEGSSKMAFSKGPVRFKAGGGLNTGQFTSAFIYWWTSQAASEFDSKLKPQLEADIFSPSSMANQIRKGNAKEAKAMSIGAAAFGTEAATWEEAYNRAKADLEGKANGYIEMARQRRRLIYGDEGYSSEDDF